MRRTPTRSHLPAPPGRPGRCDTSLARSMASPLSTDMIISSMRVGVAVPSSLPHVSLAASSSGSIPETSPRFSIFLKVPLLFVHPSRSGVCSPSLSYSLDPSLVGISQCDPSPADIDDTTTIELVGLERSRLLSLLPLSGPFLSPLSSVATVWTPDRLRLSFPETFHTNRSRDGHLAVTGHTDINIQMMQPVIHACNHTQPWPTHAETPSGHFANIGPAGTNVQLLMQLTKVGAALIADGCLPCLFSWLSLLLQADLRRMFGI